MERGALKVINGDARIADARVQEALGYARINDLHRVIGKHEAELSRYGEVFRQTGKKPSAKGGRPTVTYYLNEAQATLVCMFARTPRAADARQTIVEVFTAWRKGQLDQMAGPKADPFARAADRTGHARDQLQALAEMPALAREITHLPVWANGRRPDFWSDFELRTFFTLSHRQMKLADCVEEARAKFGRTISVQALSRYWMILDRATGLDAGKRARRRRAA